MCFNHTSCNQKSCTTCLYPHNTVLKGLDSHNLAELEKNRTHSMYKRGDVVLAEGNHNRGLVCINKGMLASFYHAEPNKLLDFYMPGEFVVSDNLLGEGYNRYSVKALTNCEVCFLDFHSIDEMLHHNIHFVKKLIQSTTQKYSDFITRKQRMQALHMTPRLAYTLKVILEKTGIDSRGFLPIYLPRKDWASLSDMSTANAIRAFSELSNMGLIQMDKKKISFPDPSQLTDYIREKSKT